MIKKMLLMLPIMVTTMILAIAPKVEASSPTVNYYDNTTLGLESNIYRMTVFITLNGADTITIENPYHVHNVIAWVNYPSTAYDGTTLQGNGTNSLTLTNLSQYNYITLQYPKSNLPSSSYPSPGYTDFATVQQTTVTVPNPDPTINFPASIIDIEANNSQWSYGWNIPIETIGAPGDTTFPADYPNTLYSLTQYVTAYGIKWYTDDPTAISKVYYYTSAGNLISFTDQIDYENTFPANTGSFRLLSVPNADYTQTPKPTVYLDPEAAVKITYQDYLGNVIAEYYFNQGIDLTNLDNELSTNPNVPREGFNFTGWSAPYVVGTTDAIKTPTYSQIPTYTVTFENYDGTVLGTDTVQQGESASAPIVPARTGYNFTGWLPPIADIQGNITTVAQYTPIIYTITWQQNGNVLRTDQVAYDELLPTPPDSQDPLRVIVGWFTDDTQQEIDLTTYTVERNIILVSANELIPSYSITWRDPSFNTIAITTVASGVVPIPPSYVADSGFILTGWTPTIVEASENTQYIAVVEPAPEQTSGTIIYRTQLPDDYDGITDLFGGVFGAIVGTIMILGTIDLFGVQLSSLFWLFFAGSGFFMIWRFVK